MRNGHLFKLLHWVMLFWLLLLSLHVKPQLQPSIANLSAFVTFVDLGKFESLSQKSKSLAHDERLLPQDLLNFLLKLKQQQKEFYELDI